MTTLLPSLFVGSSTKGLSIANAVKAKLEEVARVTVWTEHEFRLSHSTLEGLIAALDQFDFAVMIITPDDLLNSDNESYISPRDNVLFELGLFMGRIGRERTFILDQNTPSLKLPSDLAGITRANYNLDGCTIIANTIRRLGRLHTKVETYHEVYAAFMRIKEKILDREWTLDRAELIQHSSERASTLVSALADIQTDIKLYLQHPETVDTVCSELRPRLTSRLRFYPHELKSHNYEGNLQIYLYKTPASFDGIRLWKKDKTVLLVMGWYTYLSEVPLTDLTESKFRGSENPCFTMDNSHPHYRHFAKFFDDLVSSCATQGTPPVFQMSNGAFAWLPGWP